MTVKVPCESLLELSKHFKNFELQSMELSLPMHIYEHMEVR